MLKAKLRWNITAVKAGALRRTGMLLMLLLVLVPLVQELYHPTAEAAALTVTSGASETQQTTSSATYVASDTSIASGSLPAGTYIVMWGAAVANNNSSEITSAQLTRGSTEIAQLGSESNAAAAANNGRGASGYWLGSLSGSEALTINYKVSLNTTTGYISAKFIKAVRLDTNLVEDADYYTSGSAESSTDEITNAVTTDWTTIKSITKTFSSGAAQNYLVFASMEISPDSTSNDCMSELVVDGTAVSVQQQEGEDATDQYGYVLADLYSIGAGSKTLSLEGESVGGASCDYRRSRIHVLRANVFDQVLENESLSESQPTGSTTWVTKTTQAFTPNQSENVMVMFNWMAGSSATDSPLATRINNSTDTVTYASGMSHAVNNTAVDYTTGMSAASLSMSTAKTFNGEFQRPTGTGNPKIKEAHLIVWSTTIKSPSLNQSTYRWYNNTEAVGSGWYNASWTARRKITFTNSTSSNLVDFPARISLTSANIDYNNTQNSGQDIRFVDADGTTLLKHEIEKWNESGTSEVWVKVPQIDANTITDFIYMYYGNASVSDGQDASNTWNSNYRGVWHMAATSGTEPDKTSYGSSGSLTGAGTTRGSSGQIGNAYTFPNATGNNLVITDPVDGHLDFGTGSFAFECWFNSASSTGTFQQPMYKGANTATQAGYNMTLNSTNTIYAKLSDGTTDAGATPMAMTYGQWQHVIFVVNRTANTIRGYLNGVPVGAAVDASLVGSANSAFNMYIGSSNSGSFPFNGLIDEFRVMNGLVTADWIAADYANQSNTMASYSGEDLGSLTPLTSADSVATSLGSAGEANFRLRVAMHVAATNLQPHNGTFKLQAAQRSGTCDTAFVGETYNDITQGSGAIRYLDNGGKLDGQAMPEVSAPVHGSDTTVPQTYEESNNFTALKSTEPGQDALWEFSLVNNSIAFNQSYCVRVVYSSGSTLGGYTVIPDITSCASPPLSAHMRHGKVHCSSAGKKKFYW